MARKYHFFLLKEASSIDEGRDMVMYSFFLEDMFISHLLAPLPLSLFSVPPTFTLIIEKGKRKQKEKKRDEGKTKEKELRRTSNNNSSE